MAGPQVEHWGDRDRHHPCRFRHRAAGKRRDFVAVVFGRDSAQKDIGVGAALGGPMVLATISYAVVGFAMLWNHRRLGRTTHVIECDSMRLRRDQAWFLCIFIGKVALGLLVFNYKPWLGALFLLAYAVYLLRELAARSS